MISKAFYRLSPGGESKFNSSLIRRVHMSLTRRDVEGIAHLARLQLSDQDLSRYTDSLTKIFAFVEQLSAVDTGAVEPMAHPLAGEAQRLRLDSVSESNHRDLYQENAPRVEAGLYVVPRVIE